MELTLPPPLVDPPVTELRKALLRCWCCWWAWWWACCSIVCFNCSSAGLANGGNLQNHHKRNHPNWFKLLHFYFIFKSNCGLPWSVSGCCSPRSWGRLGYSCDVDTDVDRQIDSRSAHAKTGKRRWCGHSATAAAAAAISSSSSNVLAADDNFFRLDEITRRRGWRLCHQLRRRTGRVSTAARLQMTYTVMQDVVLLAIAAAAAVQFTYAWRRAEIHFFFSFTSFNFTNSKQNLNRERNQSKVLFFFYIKLNK